MRSATFVRFLFAFTFIAALGGGLGAGCAKRETAEMTQQRTEMTQDHQAWNSDLQTWETSDSQLRAVMTAPPTGGGAADTTGMSDRLARLEAHEQALTQFRQEVADMDAKLQSYQASDHATLWAENVRLKAEYDRLRSEHDQLVAQLGGAPGMGEARTDTTASRY
ncbi:MAG TPA: hypothetical protein VFR25_07255 [Candidatus Eisenbacteria bacterium]|nr:hypothetical protein [Candidatus Eisenbacteria bacterium]